MSRSKNVNTYPLQLYELVEGVLTHRKVVTIPCVSLDERNALRRQIYGLRTALMSTESHPLNLLAAKLTCRQAKSGFDLLLCHQDDIPLPAGVTAALAQLGAVNA